MAILETISTHNTPEAGRIRFCGLIAEELMDSYECQPLEEEEREFFDRLCDISCNGFVVWNQRLYRVTHRLEEGNEVRSVVEYNGLDTGGLEIWRAVSFISHQNGKTYSEWHYAKELGGTLVEEPGVGTPEVKHSTDDALFKDYLLHYHIAYDASPLPIAA